MRFWCRGNDGSLNNFQVKPGLKYAASGSISAHYLSEGRFIILYQLAAIKRIALNDSATAEHYEA
jgi:hypothetical protein